MLRKAPRGTIFSKVKTAAKVIIAGEVILFTGCYFYFRKLNNNRDHRYYMYQNYNWILEAYYSVGERLSSEYKGREFDKLTWISEGKEVKN